MLENPEKPTGRVTLRQGLLIGVLAVIFLVVLISQFGTADTGSPPAGPAVASVGAARRPSNLRTPAGERRTIAHRTPAKPARPWPTYTLATVLEYDPFSRPASLAEGRDSDDSGDEPDEAEAKRSEEAERKLAEREQALAQLRQATVRAVIATDQGLVAVVGTKSIRVGDRFHGFRVKEIRLDGVVLEDADE